MLVGSNLCIAHPILWQRVMRNPHRPEIVVIDPRATETRWPRRSTCRVYPEVRSHAALRRRPAADRPRLDRPRLHRRPHERLRRVRGVRRRLTRSSASPRKRGCRPRRSSGSPPRFTTGKRVSFWWTMGVNQSHQAVRTAQAIINLALMTGNIGRPGTGANSITGQCNAMGSRLFSNTTNLLGGHDFANADASPQGRRRARASTKSRIPRETSWPYHRILEGILRGEIRGLWVVATNPAHSWINQGMARDVLDRLDFLVVQDMYHTTETAQLAHLVLPAAGWGEKEGTFINSERRIGVTSKVRARAGPGARRLPHLQAHRRLLGLRRDVPRWDSPAAVFQLLKQLSAGQPCDITGIDDYDMLDERGGIQWPSAADVPTIRPGAATLRGRPFLPPRRPGAVSVRDTPRPLPEPPNQQVSVRAAHRPRLGRPVAHANSHRQVGRPAQAYTRTSCTSRSIRRTRPDSAFARATCRHVVAARTAAPAAPRHARRPAGAGFHSHALRRHESADELQFRPLLAPAGVQGVRGEGGIESQRVNYSDNGESE